MKLEKDIRYKVLDNKVNSDELLENSEEVKKAEKYKEWRENVLSQSKKDATSKSTHVKEMKKKSSKQATIGSFFSKKK